MRVQESHPSRTLPGAPGFTCVDDSRNMFLIRRPLSTSAWNVNATTQEAARPSSAANLQDCGRDKGFQ